MSEKEKKKKSERSYKEFQVGGFARVIRKKMRNRAVRTGMMVGPDYSVGITEMPDQVCRWIVMKLMLVRENGTQMTINFILLTLLQKMMGIHFIQ